MQTSPRAIVAASASASRRPAPPRRGCTANRAAMPAGAATSPSAIDDDLVPLGQARGGERVELRAQHRRVAADEQDAGVDRVTAGS